MNKLKFNDPVFFSFSAAPLMNRIPVEIQKRKTKEFVKVQENRVFMAAKEMLWWFVVHYLHADVACKKNKKNTYFIYSTGSSIYICPFLDIFKVFTIFPKKFWNKLYVNGKLYYRASWIRKEIGCGTILVVATPTWLEKHQCY